MNYSFSVKLLDLYNYVLIAVIRHWLYNDEEQTYQSTHPWIDDLTSYIITKVILLINSIFNSCIRKLLTSVLLIYSLFKKFFEGFYRKVLSYHHHNILTIFRVKIILQITFFINILPMVHAYKFKYLYTFSNLNSIYSRTITI